MAADGERRALMVHGRRAHMMEGEGAAMGLEQGPHALDAPERVGRDLLQQRLAVPRGEEMVGMGDDAVAWMQRRDVIGARFKVDDLPRRADHEIGRARARRVGDRP